MNTISIYQYDDYRLFLRDLYLECKKSDPELSSRRFASKAGFSNPGFFNDVIKGRRKLSDDAREKMVAAFSLSAIEAQYFRLLVAYAQSKDEETRHEIYQKICLRKNRSSWTRLNPAQSRYYQDFRYPLVCTALMAFDCYDDFESLARFIYPPLSSSVVKKCVEDLCEWGLVIKNVNGKYEAVNNFIEPSPTLKEHVKQINRDWILHAAEALMKVSAANRHISTMLLSVSHTKAKVIAKKIEQFRQEIWDLLEDDNETPKSVMQLNIQYIPRSKNGEKS